jgi:Concanavalin A-like lectin/glucanases superfamily
MSLIAAYSFDNSTVADVTGRGHNGSLFNSPSFVTGHTSLGLDFESSLSQYVTVPDHVDFNLGNVWTVMCWANFESFPAGGSELVCKANQWWFSTTAAAHVQGGIYKAAGGTQNVIGTTVVGSGSWQHVAFRSNGTNLHIVLNGTQDGDSGDVSPYTMIDTTDLVRMGSWDGATEFLDGILDDVRIFDTYLDDTTVTSYMNTPVDNLQVLRPDADIAIDSWIPVNA